VIFFRGHGTRRFARTLRWNETLAALSTDPLPLGSVNVTAQPLVRDVILSDGSTLRLRAPTPGDYEDIKAFYDRLSPESLHMRFHGMVRTDVPARYLVEAGGVDRLALICRHGDRVVAVASYDRLLEPGVAEVAFAVADDFRRRWTATRLLEQLAAIAAEQGIRRFDAEVLADNRAALGVLKKAGFGVRRKGAGGEVTVVLDITPTEAVWERIDERDHRGVVASLRPVLAPTSIAIVGASDAPDDPGGAVLSNVVDGRFQGVATPINRAGGVIRSIRAADSIAGLQEVPELVVIAVPPSEVVDIAREAAEKGAKALVVLAGEVADEGDQAREREERLLEVVRGAGMRLVGPDCLGVLNSDPQVSLNATFAGFRVLAGRLAICSESGAIGIALLGHAAARRLGVSSFASLGHRADVSTNDLLELWEEDERTAVVMLYIETVGNPERFSRIARRVARRKPILAVKGHRRPDAPRSDARTHTSAALHGDAVVDALLHHGGVQRFRSGEELFNAAEFYEHQPLPAGRQIGIVANSAGMATLAADACATRGLIVAEPRGRVRNPLVMQFRAGSKDYVRGVREILRDAGVDALMVFYVDPLGGDPDGALEAISVAAAGQGKPLVACVVTAEGELPTGRGPGVPNFRFPESCADVLARAVERRDWLSRPVGEPPRYEDLDPAAAREQISSRLDRGQSERTWLARAEAEALLATHGVTVVPSHQCAKIDCAVAAADEIGGPIAIKAVRPPPAYAGDIDAVLLGLEGEAAVRAGWQELERRVRQTGRPFTGAVLQRLMPPGADVLVGTVIDPELGRVMAVGLGGRHGGLAGTAAFRLPPNTDIDADELIDASKAVTTQLDGSRGLPRLDRHALRELVLRFALLLREAPEIAEADLNPVRCMTHGCAVLDTHLRIDRARPIDRVKTW
jgi:acyl-CoA synthetase (NDP forming)/ribosomal protein S18 acetylase RimI-like enzyme